MEYRHEEVLPDLGADIRVDRINYAQTGDLCTHIRLQVFVAEQMIPEAEELDGLDSACEHYILWVDGKAAGTARVFYDEMGGASIQRVAVLDAYRGKGFGRALMLHIIRDIQKRHPQTVSQIRLGAQIRVQPFYESLGFRSYGTVYQDAHIPHIRMKLDHRAKAVS